MFSVLVLMNLTVFFSTRESADKGQIKNVLQKGKQLQQGARGDDYNEQPQLKGLGAFSVLTVCWWI